MIGAAHKQAIVTLVERKRGFAVLAKVSNKTADLVGRAVWVDHLAFAAGGRGQCAIHQFWHARLHKDPGHQWLRGLVAQCFGDGTY